LESVLDPFNLPVEVFHNLIATYQAHLPVWQRYWEARRRALGLQEIRPYDLFAPLAMDPPKVSYTQAVEWLDVALRPLGEDYVALVRQVCLEKRWVDWAPNAGKMHGAFAMFAFDMPPWILMSYDESVMSMSVLAHELGHALQHHLIAQNQPDIYNDFPSMVIAETASNFHQAMLRSFLLQGKAGDRDFQLALLDEALFVFHRYFFIMPTLARFEDEVYRRADSGQPLTAEILNNLMADLFAEGYGTTLADERDRTALTWAQFPHLYNPFYTFQYAIGISCRLADKILSGRPGAAEAYLR
jgi:oligoendopeptidase F